MTIKTLHSPRSPVDRASSAAVLASPALPCSAWARCAAHRFVPAQCRQVSLKRQPVGPAVAAAARSATGLSVSAARSLSNIPARKTAAQAFAKISQCSPTASGTRASRIRARACGCLWCHQQQACAQRSSSRPNGTGESKPRWYHAYRYAGCVTARHWPNGPRLRQRQLTRGLLRRDWRNRRADACVTTRHIWRGGAAISDRIAAAPCARACAGVRIAHPQTACVAFGPPSSPVHRVHSVPACVCAARHPYSVSL
jgi:hypothetical protein